MGVTALSYRREISFPTVKKRFSDRYAHAERWFAVHDPESVAFEYRIIQEVPLRCRVAPIEDSIVVHRHDISAKRIAPSI
jgi:hypothetical protein